jgi:hypothetical protein
LTPGIGMREVVRDVSSDPTSFHDIDIEMPDITIQNVGPQDITASTSLADVYNAGQSINGRWAVQSCKPAVNTDGRIILTMHIGAWIHVRNIVSYSAIGLPQQRQIEAQQKPQQEDLGKKLEKYAQLRQKGLLTEEDYCIKVGSGIRQKYSVKR